MRVKGCDVGRRRALAARAEEAGTVDGSLYERLGGVDSITAVTRAAVNCQMMDDFKVGKAEQDELLNILAPLQGEIVEVDSDQVGTPLPSAFAPAPAL